MDTSWYGFGDVSLTRSDPETSASVCEAPGLAPRSAFLRFLLLFRAAEGGDKQVCDSSSGGAIEDLRLSRDLF